MKYEPLYKYYYNDKNEYRALYETRISGHETVRLDIDISGSEAFYVPCSDIYALTGSILRTDKQVALVKKALPAEAVHQFRMESLIDEIIITNNIEGVHSTRREIQDVLDSLAESRRQEKRFEGLVNQYILLGYKNLDLSRCEDIRKLYDDLVLSEVLANDPKNAPDGTIFRKHAVDVVSPTQKVIHTGMHPEEKIIEYMQKSLSILNDESVDILVRTAIFHYLFGYIHPFYDGNGRLSRFISSYCLSTDLDSLIGSRLSYTIQDNISDYYKMFKICNDPVNKGDLTPFINMFLEIVLKAEENLLYALTKRRDLYEENNNLVFELARRDDWDEMTVTLCRSLLISSLFSRNGLNKKYLLKVLHVKSPNTLSSRLDTLRNYGLVLEEKDGRMLYYKLRYERLAEVLAGEGADGISNPDGQ